MMASNNNDTARYTYRNIFPLSHKMSVLRSSSKMKTRLRYSSLLVKRLLNIYIPNLYC